MTPSKVLFWFSISFVGGIALQSFANIPRIILWGMLVLSVVMVFAGGWLFSNAKLYIRVGGLCLLFLALGILRLQVAEIAINLNPLRNMNDRPENVTLNGFITKEPDIRERTQIISIKTEGGVVLVTAERYPEYAYLDNVVVTGKLKTPADFNGFNYRNFLMKEGIYSVMSFPDIELVSDKKGRNAVSFLYGGLLAFKGKLRESINTHIDPPKSSVLEGMILGNSRAMTPELQGKLSATGVRHLTAISGLHIVVLSSILMSSLLLFGFWRTQAFYIAVVLIWLYIAMVGFPPSGVRAGVMGSIFLLAGKLGRQNTSSRTIAIAATFMLLHNPMILRYDIGFQLSFLAAMGIIHIKPAIEESLGYFLSQITRQKIQAISAFFIKHGKNLSDIVLVTVSAQISTLPIVVYNFGVIPLISPVANLFILPIIPLVMFFGFLSALMGTIAYPLGAIASVPVSVLLSYLLLVVDALYQPWTTSTVDNLSWVWLFLYYLVLIGLLLYLKKIQRHVKIF